MKNGLDTYTDKYHWTGTTIAAPTATIKGQTAYTTIRKNVWQFYEVRFQKTLNRGDEIETEVAWEFDDADQAAVPFVSATIEEPTDHLCLSVDLTADLGITEVTTETSSGIGARKPLTSALVVLDPNGRAIYDQPNPQLFHHYEIKWAY